MPVKKTGEIVLEKRKVRIEGGWKSRRVFLDDIEISRYVSGVDIKMRPGLPDEVRVYLFGFLELPEELQGTVILDGVPVAASPGPFGVEAE